MVVKASLRLIVLQNVKQLQQLNFYPNLSEMKLLLSILLIPFYSFAQHGLPNSFNQRAANATQSDSIIQGNIRVVYLSAPNDTATVNIDSSQWHYIAVTKSADRHGRIYIDGQLAVDKLWDEHPNGAGDFPYLYSKIYLATSFGGGFSHFFNGQIDELRISNIVRTQQDIQTYYASNVEFDVHDANTIGLWHFNEANNTSGEFLDTVTNTNGTLYNNPYFGPGKFGNAIYFDGISQYADCNRGMPTDDITIEFWFRNSSFSVGTSTMVQPYGLYNSDIQYIVRTIPNTVNTDTLKNVGINTTTPARNLHVNNTLRLEPRNSEPDNPAKGDMYFDGVINKLRVYDGTVWQNCW